MPPPKKPGDPLGELIRIGRQEHRPPMTQEELAVAVGVRQSTVSAWEAGTARPALERIVALSRLFGLDISTLVEAGVA